MTNTRGSILRYALAYALMRVKILGRKRVLTEEERYEVADDVIYQLRKNGGDDRWKLDEPMEPPPAHST